MVVKADIPKEKLETMRSKNYSSLLQSSKRKWNNETDYDPNKVYVGEVDNESYDNNNIISNLCILIPSLLITAGFLYNIFKKKNKYSSTSIIQKYNPNNLYDTSNVSDVSFEIIDT